MTRETFDVWEEWSIEPIAFRWNGNRAFVEHRVAARGRGSGVPLREIYFSVWTIEAGRKSSASGVLGRPHTASVCGLPASLDDSIFGASATPGISLEALSAP